jgi:TPR repeat protein
MKRVDGNDAGAMHVLAGYYHYGNGAFQQDHAKAIELYTRAAELGSSISHQNLGNLYHDGGNMKKAKFYYEAAAMAGQEVARYTGTVRKHRTSFEALDTCSISWALYCNVSIENGF